MKVVIICTNHATFPSKANKTDLWLSELKQFCRVLDRQKIGYNLINLLDSQIPFDERSLHWKDEVKPDRFQGRGKVLKKAKGTPSILTGLASRAEYPLPKSGNSDIYCGLIFFSASIDRLTPSALLWGTCSLFCAWSSLLSEIAR